MQHQAGLKELSRLMKTPTRVPDNQWLLLLIAAVGGPEHPLFQKGYVPPVEAETLQPLFKQPLIDNRDGFFDAAKPVSTFFWMYHSPILPFVAFCSSNSQTQGKTY